MDVAVRELKAKLSAYLQRAAGGELITVTDRGRPVAVLGPPIGAADLDAAAAAGWLTRATVKGLRPTRRFAAVRPVQEVLDEDRGE
ncbi:type II toxin-antitoxin system Phd/YefM family antitoxin [Rhabdothermincola sediminis]|uniref:type II toxin-antitoxin system Phd/YefM family antitoxin n=1 Tax=Rhabdothermincola sediminis TaxID=2751370 RepID=UPI001AA07FDE|nr:type II toxin-antitoxin system prevent-host-death family antitoxin [Rhabdothermincola sediminis]